MLASHIRPERLAVLCMIGKFYENFRTGLWIQNSRGTLARIEALVEEYQVETIVLGYPKNMDDSIGERALKTEEFRNMLVRRTGLPVVLWDERLTTIEANEILIESGVRREDRKKVIDKIAATLILQSYLGSLK